MKTYDFELVVAGGQDDLTDAMVDRLYESGCDDATVGCRGDVIYLTFAREAESLKSAIASATADVQRAGCTVTATVRSIGRESEPEGGE